MVGDEQYAREAVNRLQNVDRNPSRALTAEGYAAAAAGEWERACECFERAVDRKPLNCCAHAWLGIAYLERKRIDDAQRKLADAEARTAANCSTAAELTRRIAARASLPRA
jgi:Flp pilus assembly protein TadD